MTDFSVNDPSEYVQRLLAGCPVKEPDQADYPTYGETLAALYKACQKGGVRGAKRAYQALCNTDPSLYALIPNGGDFYPRTPEVTPDLLRRLDRYDYDESGQGEAFCDLFQDRLRFMPGAGWYVWTGQRWQLDDREAVVRYAVLAARLRRQAARARQVETNDSDQAAAQEKARDEAIRWTKSAANYNRIHNTIGLGKTVPDLIVSHRVFDRKPYQLGAANGVIDLSTGQLLPAHQEQYITHSTDLPYFPDAQAPRFERFIGELFDGDTDLVAYMQRAIGYSLTGETSEQCFFLCYGTGANGKSTLLNVLKGIAGEYAANTAFNTFEHGRQSGTGQEIVLLRGKRLVMSSETSDGSRLNEARIKAITGGDEVTGRYLFSRTEISFVPTFKLWLATNHKPTIKGSDEGIWRRVRLIPFLVSFPKERRDKHLEATLRAELPGILAWAVRGAMAWYRQGLGEPAVIEEATSAYRDESDILGLFLAENTREIDTASVKSGSLYERYQRWTETNGLGCLSSVKFARAMQDRGFEKKRTNLGAVWLKLGLLEEQES